MKTLNLKRVGTATAISTLIALRVTGAGLNSASIQISQVEFDSVRNQLAMKCSLGANDRGREDLTWAEHQLFWDVIVPQQILDDNRVITIENFVIKMSEPPKKICKNMLRL